MTTEEKQKIRVSNTAKSVLMGNIMERNGRDRGDNDSAVLRDMPVKFNTNIEHKKK